MSIARASGEKWDGDRCAFDVWQALERDYLRAFPRRYKWFTAYFLHAKLGWGVKKIAQSVGLTHGHVARVLHKTRIQVTQLEKENLAGVAQLKIADIPDDE